MYASLWMCLGLLLVSPSLARPSWNTGGKEAWEYQDLKMNKSADEILMLVLSKGYLRFPLVGEEEPISTDELPVERINLHHSFKDVLNASSKAIKDVHKYLSQKVTSVVEEVGNKVSRPLAKIIAPVVILKDRLENLLEGKDTSETSYPTTEHSETTPHKDIQSSNHGLTNPHPDDHPIYHEDSSFTLLQTSDFSSAPDKEGHTEDFSTLSVQDPTIVDPVEDSDFTFAGDEVKKAQHNELPGKDIELAHSESDIDIRFANGKEKLNN